MATFLVRTFICLFLIYLLFNASDCSISCYDEQRNEIIANGMTVVSQKQPCNLCQCANGMFACQSIECEPVLCLDAVLLSDRCCPVCAGDLPSMDPSPLFTKSLHANCSNGHISVSIKKEFASGDIASDLSFNDRNCIAKEKDGRFVLETHVDECGTEVLDLPNAVVFKNRVRSRFFFNSVITRRALIDFEAACVYPKSSDISKPIRIQMRPPTSLTQRIVGRGRIDTRLELLDSQLRVVSVSQKALTIIPGATIYFRVRSHGVEGTNMQMDTKKCTVLFKKRHRRDAFYGYDLINDGCIVEPSMKRVENSSEESDTYSFKVLSHLQSDKLRLVLQCDTVLCIRNSKRCLKECN